MGQAEGYPRGLRRDLIQNIIDYYFSSVTTAIQGPWMSFFDANSPDRQDHEIVSGETGGRAPFFSRLGYGGNRSPELVEGNAEGESIPRKQVAEKTSP